METNEKKGLARIHIDRQPYESPNPTTGEALYALGGIEGHVELFREVDGGDEDELVRRGDDHIRLKPDEHFYSQKVFNIIVNTEKKEVLKPRLTFDELVILGLGSIPTGENIKITVDYGMGPKANPQGSLQPDESVRLKNKMVFDVSATDRS